MKKLLFLSALLLALAGRARAQAGPDIVVVRIHEAVNVTVIITRGEGKSEKIEFDNGFTDKGLTRTSEGYYKLFKQLYSEGYMLQNSMTSDNSSSSGYLTLLFVKKQ